MIKYDPKWTKASPDQLIVDEVATITGVSKTVAAAMVNRGVSPDEAELYISAACSLLPNPFLLLNMETAATRLAKAVMGAEKVAVWLDYDGDGQTAGALLCWLGRMLGANFRPYIPDRISEGYGMNEDGVRLLAQEGMSLLVTVDCGITSHLEAMLCQDLGMDLVITDHHTPGEQIPAALAVVNPLLPGDRYPFKKIAGVGVAYNLAAATIEVLHKQGWFNESRPKPCVEDLLPLVAIGTVADVVELQSVNRVMVTQGIDRIRKGKHLFEGIRALCDVSCVAEEAVASGQIAFRLAPRLNAGGRMETARIGFNLLMETRPLVSAGYAAELDRLNKVRQETEEMVVNQAIQMFESNPDLWERKTIVLASTDWHPGVIGIAASRMVERYHRPTVLIALDGDKGKGSCRSIKPFHLYEGLCKCSELLAGFGGHPMAAGLSIESTRVAEFAEAFERSAGHLTVDDLRPVVVIDAEAEAGDVSLAMCDEIEQMEPFGMGNSRPLFSLTECQVADVRVLKGKHLKLDLLKDGKAFSAIGFNMADLPLKDVIDVAFAVEKNEWRGNVSLQLQLKSIG